MISPTTFTLRFGFLHFSRPALNGCGRSSVSICMSTPLVEVPPQCSEMDANGGAGGPVSRRVTSIRIPYFTIQTETTL